MIFRANCVSWFCMKLSAVFTPKSSYTCSMKHTKCSNPSTRSDTQNSSERPNWRNIKALSAGTEQRAASWSKCGSLERNSLCSPRTLAISWTSATAAPRVSCCCESSTPQKSRKSSFSLSELPRATPPHRSKNSLTFYMYPLPFLCQTLLSASFSFICTLSEWRRGDVGFRSVPSRLTSGPSAEWVSIGVLLSVKPGRAGLVMGLSAVVLLAAVLSVLSLSPSSSSFSLSLFSWTYSNSYWRARSSAYCVASVSASIFSHNRVNSSTSA